MILAIGPGRYRIARTGSPIGAAMTVERHARQIDAGPVVGRPTGPGTTSAPTALETLP